MTEEQRQNHSYLGDGVYAEWDGEYIILRTGDHRDEYCDNKIYLEPGIVKAFQLFSKRIFNKAGINEND